MVFFFVAKFLTIDDLRKGKEREYLVANFFFFFRKTILPTFGQKSTFLDENFQSHFNWIFSVGDQFLLSVFYYLDIVKIFLGILTYDAICTWENKIKPLTGISDFLKTKFAAFSTKQFGLILEIFVFLL